MNPKNAAIPLPSKHKECKIIISSRPKKHPNHSYFTSLPYLTAARDTGQVGTPGFPAFTVSIYFLIITTLVSHI